MTKEERGRDRQTERGEGENKEKKRNEGGR